MKTYITVLLLCVSAALSAQNFEITREVIAAAGSSDTVGNLLLEYTIGETGAIEVFKNQDFELSQGFHQNVEISTGISEGTFEGRISVFPNPASREVFVEAESEYQNIQCTLTDMQGRVVKEFTMQGKDKTSFNVEEYAAATYHLSLTGSGNKFRKTYSIIVKR